MFFSLGMGQESFITLVHNTTRAFELFTTVAFMAFQKRGGRKPFGASSAQEFFLSMDLVIMLQIKQVSRITQININQWRCNLFKVSIFLEMFLGFTAVDTTFILTMKHSIFLFGHI